MSSRVNSGAKYGKISYIHYYDPLNKHNSFTLATAPLPCSSSKTEFPDESERTLSSEDPMTTNKAQNSPSLYLVLYSLYLTLYSYEEKD